MYGIKKGLIRLAIIAALPRLRGDSRKIDQWVGLFAGWFPTNSGASTTITAPTSGTASNVARRAWKNQKAEKGTRMATLADWNFETGLMLKVSNNVGTDEERRDSMRVAITQSVPKILACLPDTDGDPRVAVSNDPHGDGVTVTAYWLDRGEVRPGG